MLGALSVISFFVEMRLAVFGPFFSLYLRNELGATYTQIGIILTVMVGTNALFQIVWGWASDRVAKRKHFLVVGEGIPGLIFFLIPKITSVVALTIVLAAVNILWSMGAPVWKALIAEHSNPGERGRLMGKIATVGGIGSLIGLYIVKDLITQFGYAYLFYFCSFCLLATAVTALFAREPKGLQPTDHNLLSKEQVKTLYTEHRHFSVFTILTLLHLFTLQLIEGFISLYAESLGATVRHIGWLLIVRDGTATAFLIPMGKLTDSVGKVGMLKRSLAFSAFAIFLFAIVSTWWHLFFVVVVEMIAYSGYVVSSFAVLSSLTPREMRGTYMGFHSMVTTSSSVGSSVGGRVADGFGLKALFFMSFVLAAVIACFFINWLHKNTEAINQSKN